MTALLAAALVAAAPGEEDRPEAEAGLRTATFSMYCYWTGEATVGRVDGVVASRSISRILQRRAGGKDPLSARSEFHTRLPAKLRLKPMNSEKSRREVDGGA